MARTKQATPIRRNPSSEYTSKQQQQKADKVVNGTANGKAHLAQSPHGSVLKDALPPARKEAGALQFFLAVGGIYGSL